MEKDLLKYFTILRDFGRLYTQKIIDGNPKVKTDLKMSQIKALYAFRDHDGLSMKELADSLGLKMPSMTILADGLEREGIIRRQRDGKDRRKVFVWLTPKGKRIRSDFLARRHRIARTVIGSLNGPDKAELLGALGSVCRILEKAFVKTLA